MEITHQRSCYQLSDPNDVRGIAVQVWMHSANQIISFHFALAIYDEFDANAMVATNAVSLSMCNCTFFLETMSHYSDRYWRNRNRRLGVHSGRNYCQLEPINMWFARHRPKPTANAFNSCRQNCRHATLSTIFTKFGVQKSVSVRRLLGLDRFTRTIHQLGII